MIDVKADMSFKDKGLKALLDRVRDAGKQKLEVGVFDADAELSEIAAAHEYGAPEAHIPQRSYLRSTLRSSQQLFAKILKDSLTLWQVGQLTLEQALNRLSIIVVSQVQKSIIHGIAPPLKDATVAAKKRKGYARPGTALYATGRLFNAIKARIV